MECDETFLAEIERDLEKAWVLVGTEAQVQGLETWFVYEAAGRSLIVARDREGRLGAFVNSCSHRGTRLCRGSGSGRLTCPYHGWVFGCDGRLLGAFRRAGLPEFDDADYGLARLSVATLGCLIFVHSDPAPPDLRVALGAVALELHELGEPAFEERRVVPQAWRTVMAHRAEPATLARVPAAPPTHTTLPPNGELLSVGAVRIVTTFTPLGPTRTQQVSRVFDAPGVSRGMDSAAARGWLRRFDLD